MAISLRESAVPFTQFGLYGYDLLYEGNRLLAFNPEVPFFPASAIAEFRKTSKDRERRIALRPGQFFEKGGREMSAVGNLTERVCPAGQDLPQRDI
jgi:hypothetical protein